MSKFKNCSHLLIGLPRTALFLVLLPGFILLIRPQASSTAPPKDQAQVPQNSEVKVLEKQIELIANQQQNFINIGQNFINAGQQTLNYLLMVILAFVSYNALKEVFLDRREKKQIVDELKTEISKRIDEILPQKISDKTHLLEKQIIDKTHSLEKNLKLLEYQIAVVSAEQLYYCPDNPYQNITALYEYIRATQRLIELQAISKIAEQDINVILNNIEKKLKEIDIDIDRDRQKQSNKIPQLNAQQIEQMKYCITKIYNNNPKTKKLQEDFYKIISKLENQ